MNQEANCPPEAELRDYCLGKLDPDVWDGISSHVDACGECQTAVVGMDDTHDSLARELRVASPAPAESPEIARLVRLASAHRDEPGPDREELTHLVRESGTGPADLPGVDGVLGQYHLLEKLGEGGMGIVYRAEHLRLKRSVAVKILSQKRFADPTAAERFQREVESLGRLQHPHIVNATDAGDEDGVLYLVMEYVDGVDFSKLSDRHGPLSVPDACELVRQAALGLQHAHEQGCIHRDIKPANLMLATDATGTPVVKILDLGLARLCRDESTDGLTETGQVMGTADYMPPEQSTGSHAVDIRSDLYSLGCTFYRLLAGRAPFTGPDFRTAFERMRAHVELVPAPLETLRSDLPAVLSLIIDRLLAKSPDDRFQTPVELAEALEPFTTGCALAALLSDSPYRSDAGHEGQPVLVRSDDGVGPTKAARRTFPFPFVSGLVAASVTVFAVLWAAGILSPRVDTPHDSVVLDVEPDAAGGEPVSVMALVQNPVRLKGVTSWTIETIEPRGAIRDVAFQPDTDLLATAGDDGCIRIWDAETVQLKSVFVGHNDAVVKIEWSPDGTRLASLSTDGSIRVWKAVNGGLIADLKPKTPAEDIIWSPDGIQLASRSRGEVLLWQTDSGEQMQRVTHGDADVHSVDWSSDGKRIVTSGSDAVIRFWSTESGSERDALKYHNAAVKQVTFSPDDRYLASCGAEGIVIWEHDQDWRVIDQNQYDHSFTDASWSPDGKTLAACAPRSNRGGQLATWSRDSRDWITSVWGGGTIERVLWSADGRRVALAAAKRSTFPTHAVHVHRVDSDGHKLEFTAGNRWHFGSKDRVTCVAWSSSRAVLATGGLASIAVRNGESGQISQEIFAHPPLGGMKWSPNGNAVGARHASNTDDYDRDVRRHTPTSEVFVWTGGKTPDSIHLREDKGRSIHEVAWSSNGELLAAAGGRIRIWDVKTKRTVQTLPQQGNKAILDLEWSPAGNRLVAGHGSDIEMWDLDTNDKPWASEVYVSGNEVVWTRDGRFLLVPAGSHTRVYDAESGQKLAVMFPGNGMRAPVLNPDGKRIAISTGPGKIALFDFATGDALASPPPGKNHFTVLKWSPEGELLYSLREDGQISAWSQNENRTFEQCRIPARFGVFSPDARRIAFAVSNDIRVVDVGTGETHATLIALRDSSTYFITPDGRTTIGEDFDDAFVYVTVTETGQEMRSESGISGAGKWNTEPLSGDLLAPQAR